MDRRKFIQGATAVTAGLAAPFVWTGSAAAQQSASRFYKGYVTDGGFTFRATNYDAIDKRWRRQMVQYYSDEPIGTVVIDTRNHYLYWIWENNTALRYGVGVGREGFQWFGRANIARKARWPRWTPPPEMRKRQPSCLPIWIRARIIRWDRVHSTCTMAVEIRATACTAPPSPGPSVRTCRRAVSVSSMKM